MAICYFAVKPVSRGQGKRATAAAAYRCAGRIHDRELGTTFDFTRKAGVEHVEIVLPANAEKDDVQWARDRQELWNTAEAAEKRKNARVAREYVIALPFEMSAAQRLQLTRAFSQELADRYNCAVDIAVHAPTAKGDQRNHHAHLLATTREVTPSGLGRKTEIEWRNGNRQKLGLQSTSREISGIRRRWQDLTNSHLQSLGIDARIDHRSLHAQGIDRIPGTHLGPAVTDRLQRGKDSYVLERIASERRQEAILRLDRGAERGRLAWESLRLERAIRDTQMALLEARFPPEHQAIGPDNDQLRSNAKLMPDEARHLAQDQWLRQREAFRTASNAREEVDERSLGLDLGG
jgi:ATP-dependent exoDNAse (exonuclease V) alpha subunit